MSLEITNNPQLNKEENYRALLPQLKALVAGEEDLYANLANIGAALKTAFNWWWVGFYIVQKNELVLGPFQGPVACTRIAFGKGVCGTAWQMSDTIIVDDVTVFPGHIACSAESRSEIVIPIIKDDIVIAVLDADSEKIAQFDAVDKKYLEDLSEIIKELF